MIKEQQTDLFFSRSQTFQVCGAQQTLTRLPGKEKLHQKKIGFLVTIYD